MSRYPSALKSLVGFVTQPRGPMTMSFPAAVPERRLHCAMLTLPSSSSPSRLMSMRPSPVVASAADGSSSTGRMSQRVLPDEAFPRAMA
jgi:hypothetical protein